MYEQILTLLGLTEEGITEDTEAKINSIISLTSDRLKNRLGGAQEVPEALQFVVVEVSVIRFNRIGSEGVSSHTVEGESMSWNQDSDFDAFAEDIEAWLDEQEGVKRGRLRFL